jgi:hypothetical protein
VLFPLIDILCTHKTPHERRTFMWKILTSFRRCPPTGRGFTGAIMWMLACAAPSLPFTFAPVYLFPWRARGRLWTTRYIDPCKSGFQLLRTMLNSFCACNHSQRCRSSGLQHSMIGFLPSMRARHHFKLSESSHPSVCTAPSICVRFNLPGHNCSGHLKLDDDYLQLHLTTD